MGSIVYAKAQEKQVENWSRKALPRGLERQLSRYFCGSMKIKVWITITHIKAMQVCQPSSNLNA